MNSRIFLSLAHMGEHELKYIQDAFTSNWVTTVGPNIDGFEADLETFLQGERRKEKGEGRREKGERFVVALNSGTAAIHLGLLQLGVGVGDEVICQSFTYAATANPIIYLGATPVFVDSETDTWNMSPAYLEEAIQDRIQKTGKVPKAIIPVHLYGMPAKMEEITAIADNYGIPILEDAAEALGSEIGNRKCGTFGEFACLSFNGNKIITTSGGGALVCSTEEQRKKTLFYATQAKDDHPHYQHSEIGYNGRMSNVLAGIGRGQMMVLPLRVEQRRSNNAYYRKQFESLPGIRFQTEPKGYLSNYWLTTILIDPEKTGGKDRETLRLALDAANIEARPLWKPMHLQPVFADYPYYGASVSEDLFNKGLCLPSSSLLTSEDMKRVTDAVREAIV